MKPELKKKWVDALLSGKYKQAEGALYDGRRFCCLGVLRHVNDKTDLRISPYGEYFSDAQLCEFGMREDVQEALAVLNDSGVPFGMIAGLIDEAL